MNSRRLSSEALEFFTRQLAALLEAGLPLDRALMTLASQSPQGVAQMLFKVRDRVREGVPFHKALAAFPRDFSESYCGLVAVGESSGNLIKVLYRVAEAQSVANQLRQGLLSAMAYPVIVTVVALLVVVILMSYVVPQIVAVLDSQRQELPLLTQALIVTSNLVSRFGLLILLVTLLASAGLFFAAIRYPAFRLWIDRTLLRLPLVGSMSLASEISRFAGTLAISLVGGVNLISALETAAKGFCNRWLRAQIRQVIIYVREGAELARALDQVGGFPPLLVQLISTGERSGGLPKMLELAAQQLSLELRRRSAQLTTFLEPALILTMGLIVLLIVMAVMMPLIDMNTLIRS